MKVSLANKKVVVYMVDKNHPHGKNNLLFDRSVVGEHAEISPFFYEKCLENGIQLITPDIYLSTKPPRPKTILIKDTSSSDRLIKRLVKENVHPAVVMAIESPLYSCRFFYNLKQETKLFDYAFLPPGAEKMISKKTKFCPYIPTQPFSGDEFVSSDFDNKKFITLIANNKRTHVLKRIYVSGMNLLHPFPSFVNRELYKDRLEAIKFFSKYRDFDLYGRGWSKPVRYDNSKYKDAIQASYRGEIKIKLPILREYKFSICFENAIFGGYVTEKIIDSIFAGCVPIYFGAPDITRYIPEGCFIDFRDFSAKSGKLLFNTESYDKLNHFLRSINRKTYNQYIDNINRFISSDQYHNYFSKEKFVADMIKIINTYF